MSAGVALAATEGSSDLAMSDPVQDSRPSRAELRRQREVAVEAAALAASRATAPTAFAAPAPATRAERRLAAEATAAPASRAQLRAKQQKETKKRGPLRTLLTAWWVYPLIALVALFVYLGVRSAQPPSTPPGVEVTTPTPIP